MRLGSARRAAPGPTSWNRRRLQVLLAALLAAGLVVTACAVWSVHTAVTTHRPDTGEARAPETARNLLRTEDRIAASPMQTAGLQQALAGDLSEEAPGSVDLPRPGGLGEEGVVTGFPRTPEGALAQLVEIVRRAVESVSVVTAQRVIGAWAEAGGPTSKTWSGVGAVARLLSAAGMPATGSEDLQVSLRPAMGLLKGRVGETFVVPCVDYVLTVTTTGAVPQRIAVADCQRMRWVRDRWLVASGDEPAAAPSVWPGTQASYDVGYRWLEGAS